MLMKPHLIFETVRTCTEPQSGKNSPAGNLGILRKYRPGNTEGCFAFGRYADGPCPRTESSGAVT